MCGIVGIFSADRERPIDAGLVGAMARTLRHRGPDSEGSFIAAGIALGCARLSIVDLATGDQPHFNEDNTAVSVCNGEIYNHRELRRELEERGHRFRTHCDVEVLVHLYEEYGSDFVARLNGQFAFALYDRTRHRLLLGRDHVGIAPLFYTEADGQLLFGSEIKALLIHPAVERRVDLRGLDQIMTFPGLTSPTTMFEGIRSLPPGCLLETDASLRLRQYWDLVYPETAPPLLRRDAGFYVNRLDELLRQSVRRRLDADVPVSFYLSGGLDSSLVGAMACDVAPDRRFHSFSITFPDADIDERKPQRLMAERLHTIHHEIEFPAAQIVSRLRQAVTAAEAPLKESYNTCSLALSALVRDSGHKVVLTGEGADELFAGYVGYRLDATGHRFAGGTADEVTALLEEELRLELWGDPAFFYERDYWSFRDVRAGVYSADVAAAFPRFDCTRGPVVDPGRLSGRHPLHQRSFADFKLRLADHLLADHGDRVAYANSVEARYPFLDIDLIDFMRTVPPDLLVREATEKWLLRAVAARYLPPAIAQREKFGFVARGAGYLLAQGVEWINDLLSPATIRKQNYFNYQAVERLRRHHCDTGMQVNATFDTDLLMLVVCFGLFLEAFALPDYT